MNRKDFLRGLGIAGLGLAMPMEKSLARAKNLKIATGGSCTLIPSETTGPYPLDLSNNAAMFRQDIRESQAGALTKVTLKIISTNDCEPIQNARVDLWHCNAYGYYSGYTTSGQNGSINYAGQTWLRGIQMTDANGEVAFTTIFPGWYSGRVTHMHFQIFLSSVLQATSQLTFPVAEKNALYAANTPYSAYGADPTSLASDNIFSNGYAVQLATLTYNSATSSYECFMEVAINALSTGLWSLEPETGGQFKLKQNYPNPHKGRTTIPFSLTNTSDVVISLWDLTGKKVAEVVQNDLSEGEHAINIDLQGLGIPVGNYAYQLQVSNSNGVFRQCKMMTAQ
ncbi:MAG: T9SS type A sorting domain-containing protein [Saprospiraceae bacterium]|nr:T9SS type A sorting domain-containing protein [Saprospiraceae bacterium]